MAIFAITVPPEVAAKTRQKHDYPSAAHRRSCARRTSAERTFATIKDPAAATIARGWRAAAGLVGGQATFQLLSPSRATTSTLPPSAAT